MWRNANVVIQPDASTRAQLMDTASGGLDWTNTQPCEIPELDMTVKSPVRPSFNSTVPGQSVITTDNGDGTWSCTSSTMTNLEFDISMRSNVTGVTINKLKGFTSLSKFFNQCVSLAVVDLSGVDTTGVTDTSFMFWSCAALVEIDISNFDMSLVTSTYGMFGHASMLTNVTLGNHNLNNLLSVNRMFTNTSLTHIDMTGFSLGKATDMEQLFNNSEDLICITNLDTTSSTSSTDMFKDTTALVQPDAAARTALADVAGGGDDWTNPGTCP
jgi:surface protein